MTEVIDRLVTAMNAHDLDAATALIHKHYRSVQPAHPGRAFVGRDQLRANWQAMFAGIPDFHAEVARSVHDGDTTWSEWHWTGTRSDGKPSRCAASPCSRSSTVRMCPVGCTWRTSSGRQPE